ncbi:hypothetical protein [Rhizobium straminoryzae]|uniref:Uncharacterized protein n=1 Tax=Rhizobium straminoryzae TaxID=1387186 RepID=A0A549T7E9_9HYPH|nr:hypothetical protein [Rhizobium straminoryzae]TRL37780.1 hypothetical protein FNA46_14280 [Rhizobium straminoryzae]
MNTHVPTVIPDIELTPTQLRALKLAKDGDLHPQDGNRWTHRDATVTYARTDRFKERPIKIKFTTTAVVTLLREAGLIRELDGDVTEAGRPHGITMAGKMWLLKHK